MVAVCGGLDMIIFQSETNFIDSSNPVDKGYPQSVTPVTYFVGSIYPNIVGYTSYRDMGSFYFVGNTYIDPKFRGLGLYSQLLNERNRWLGDKPKITLANPIENTNIKILEYQVAKQGGMVVTNYDEVCDIMTKDLYDILQTLPMFIYR